MNLRVMSMRETLTACVTLVAICASGAAGQQPEPFLPGVVTVAGESVYRGTFHPVDGSFWFFRKLPEGRDRYRIFRTEPRGDGWSQPEPVLIGGDHSDLYPTFSPDGSLLVFTSYRPTPLGGPPQSNLWYASIDPGGRIGEPVYMDEQSVGGAYDAGPRFHPDGWLTWTSETWVPAARRDHRRARWTGSEFTAPQPDPSIDQWRHWRDDLFVWETVESPDGRWLLVGLSQVMPDGRRGPSDLWIARRERPSDAWSEPVTLGPGVNHPGVYETFAGFTPDSRHILFVRDFTTYLKLDVTEVDTALRPREP